MKKKEKGEDENEDEENEKGIKKTNFVWSQPSLSDLVALTIRVIGSFKRATAVAYLVCNNDVVY